MSCGGLGGLRRDGELAEVTELAPRPLLCVGRKEAAASLRLPGKDEAEVDHAWREPPCTFLRDEKTCFGCFERSV